MSDDGVGPFEAVVGVAFVCAAAWWGGSWLAALVFDQGLLQAGPQAAFDAAVQLPKHASNPAASWAQPYRGRLPGPVAYFVSIAGFIIAVVFIVTLARGIWSASVGQKSRTRLGRKVVGRMAHRRETITLAVEPGKVTPGRFIVGETARGFWRRHLDPRGARWLATEWRAGQKPLPWWRLWSKWWARRHQYDRGAVAILGPSRSGKTVTAVSAAMLWDGPAVFSSVKTDLLGALGPIRDTAEGAVKVFDPCSTVDAGSMSGEFGSWSPVRTAMGFEEAMAAAKSLSDSVAANVSSSGNDEFFRSQAEQLMTGLLWLAAWADVGRTRAELPPEGMAQVESWVMGNVPWQAKEGEYNDLQTVFNDVELVPDVLPDHHRRAAAMVEKVLVHQAPETKAGILGAAQNMVWPWSNPSVELAAATSDIDLEWLLSGTEANGDDPVPGEPRSLFICAPVADMKRYAPVFAGCLNSLIEQAARRFNETGKPIDPPLLILIDEAGNTPIRDLPEYASTVAGFGIQLVTVWQSYSQMESAFGDRTGTLMANFLTKIMFAGQSDKETLETWAFLLGEEEVETRSATDGRASQRDSEQTSTMLTSLAPTTVMRQMRVGDAALVHGTLPPVHIRSIKWYQSRHFAKQRKQIARAQTEET